MTPGLALVPVGDILRASLVQLAMGCPAPSNPTSWMANVCGSTIEEYAEVTRRFDDSPIDAMEINISCPNVKEGGVAFGNYPDMSARVVAACRKVTKKPLITKLSPNQTDIVANARACIDAGSDGLAVINTVMGMAIDPETRRFRLGSGPSGGGVSGPAIHPVAVRAVFDVHRVLPGLPIVGVGGIARGADAAEMILAGATAVQVGTATFADPRAPGRVRDELEAWVRRQGVAHLRELIGDVDG